MILIFPLGFKKGSFAYVTELEVVFVQVLKKKITFYVYIPGTGTNYLTFFNDKF
jgi:hypothetical protein